MRSTSTKEQAIIIALISALITIIAGLSVFLIDEPNFWVILIFIGLLVFFSVFIIVFYSLNNFIFNKLKPIYKTIKSINFSDLKLKREMEEMDRDPIQEVQNDVLVWAKKKTHEIAQLRQLEKYRREFIGDVSHELKTPIFNIQGYISTLLDGGLEDESINRRYLERADKSVSRLISTVNDLESISRLESGELELNKETFNIISLIQEVFDEHEMLANEKKIQLTLKYTLEKAVNVVGDRLRIAEVLNNLVINSIKYGENKGETTIDLFDMEDLALIEVSDNGVGIASKDLPRIFERFYRTDKSRSREMGGTGLGLAIVKHIIEAHNQTVNVRSELGKGTAFNFALFKAEE